MALGLMRATNSARVIERLFLRSQKNEDLSGQLSLALGLMHAVDQKTSLVNVLVDPDTAPVLRVEVALALKVMGATVDPTELCDLLEDSRILEKRQSAAAALGWVGGRTAMVHLLSALNDETAPERLRAECARSLSYLTMLNPRSSRAQLARHANYLIPNDIAALVLGSL